MKGLVLLSLALMAALAFAPSAYSFESKLVTIPVWQVTSDTDAKAVKTYFGDRIYLNKVKDYKPRKGILKFLSSDEFETTAGENYLTGDITHVLAKPGKGMGGTWKAPQGEDE